MILEAADQLNGKPAADFGILYCWNMFGHEMIKRRMNAESYQKLVTEITADHEE